MTVGYQMHLPSMTTLVSKPARPQMIAALVCALVVAVFVLRQPRLEAVSSSSWFAASSTGVAFPDCGAHHPHVLVYNRIPKAGSSTIIWLLRKLAIANNFDLVLPMPYYNHTSALTAVAEGLISQRRTLVCNHFNFPEVLYGEGQVAYMNIVRQPVDRCVSWYYYTRYGDRHRDLKRETIERYGNGTMDACLARPEAERAACLNCPPSVQAQAFCGRDGGPCESAPSDQLLQRAWDNAQGNFFMGLTEHLNETVAMLEAAFPDFFLGASAMLTGMKPQKVTHTREQYVEPTDASRKEIERWCDVDMKLYDLAVEQFWRLHTQCAVAGALGG